MGRPVSKEKARRIRARFKEFHEDNPKIYELFVTYAIAARKATKHIGPNMITGRIRWYSKVETTGDLYKVNDLWSAFYARMFMRDFPSNEGFFKIRKSVADGED
jgi:hypothetical protein